MILLTNVRPMGGPATSVLIRDGRIAAIGPSLETQGATTEDCGGALLIPGLVEAHTHLDKSLWGMGWRVHQAGPGLIDKIETERRLKKEWDINPARQAGRQIVQSVRMGSTHIRSHVDIDDAVGLAGMEGVLAARDSFADIIDVEIVAFPQSGLMCRPGVADLMADALRMGADVIGGLDPCGIDRDPKGQLDVIFSLAERTGKTLDIHLHEPGTMGAFSTELIIERTRALGMAGHVTISHAFCLGDPDAALVGPLLDGIAALDIAIMTTAPAARPAPPVARLRAMGIRVCSGSDGIRDTWGPYGSADMLERGMFIGMRNNLRHDADVEMALDICTFGGASVMGLQDYGVAVGCVADLVLVDAQTLTEAVVAHPPRRLVLKRGQIVARNGAALRAAP